jgi:hypothetical protein
VLALDQRTTQSQHHANGSSIPTAPIRAAENLTVNIFCACKNAKHALCQKFFEKCYVYHMRFVGNRTNSSLGSLARQTAGRKWLMKLATQISIADSSTDVELITCARDAKCWRAGGQKTVTPLG